MPPSSSAISTALWSPYNLDSSILVLNSDDLHFVTQILRRAWIGLRTMKQPQKHVGDFGHITATRNRSEVARRRLHVLMFFIELMQRNRTKLEQQHHHYFGTIIAARMLHFNPG
ncbi:uncharacterized protein LOC126799998 isoform X2 [Argentina anserina]|nr:uncharacterized protein LOC126799998 isoform X2 [Potentilla anserina]